MTLTAHIKIALRSWLDEDDSAPVARPRSIRRRMDADEVDDMLDGARTREDPLWGQIEALLSSDLGKAHPFKVDRLRRDLKWLRKQAYHRDLPWGKR